MRAFIDKHEDRIHGVLSCFDRMLFRGYLPIMSGWSMAQLLQAHEIDCSSVKPFLLANAERVKAHAVALARKHGRPFEYLSAKMRKEDAARKIAERDGVEEGLVCVFSALEPCRTFSLRFTTGQPYVQTAKRKCLHLYVTSRHKSARGSRHIPARAAVAEKRPEGLLSEGHFAADFGVRSGFFFGAGPTFGSR